VSYSRASIFAGIGLMTLATLCFAILDTSAKFAMASVPVLMALSMRYLLQAIVSTAVLLPMHGRGILVPRHPRLQLLRAAVFAITTLFAMAALKYMPVGEFAAIVMLVPMLVTVLAVVVLKERISAWQWVFVTGALVGAMMIIRPGGSVGFGWWVVLPIGCVVFSSWFQLISSHLGRLENPTTTHLCTVWLCAGLTLVLLPWTWSAVDSVLTWAALCLMGTASAIGHFLLAQAYRRAPASTLMPYMYCQIGFAVLFGWWIFAHVPDQWAWGGILLIAVCGMSSAWMTARQHRPVVVLPEG
jgi:drug/metabolite transporter (DMT)-like permease